MSIDPAGRLVGVSTGIFGHDLDRHTLGLYSPDVVEIYGLDTTTTDKVLQLVEQLGSAVSLHAPTPFDGHRPFRFFPTSSRAEEVDFAIGSALTTIDLAARIGALHVVVHFPSPRPEGGAESFPSRADRFLHPVVDHARDRGVPLLIENLSFHDQCHTADHYRQVLERHPHLELCLDIGHAHLSAVSSALDFMAEVGPRIASVHAYELAPDDKGHQPLPTRDGSDLVMTDDVIAALRRLPALRSVVLEVHPIPRRRHPAAAAGLDRLRRRLGLRPKQSAAGSEAVA